MIICLNTGKKWSTTALIIFLGKAFQTSHCQNTVKLKYFIKFSRRCKYFAKWSQTETKLVNCISVAKKRLKLIRTCKKPISGNTSEIFLENFRKKHKKNINLAVCVMMYKKSGLQEQKLKDVEKKRDLVCGWDQVGPS